MVLNWKEDRCYLGDGVLVREDVEEEERRGLSLAVGDWAVAVHHKILLDPRRQVFLPARLQYKQSQTLASTLEPPPAPPETERGLTRQQ